MATETTARISPIEDFFAAFAEFVTGIVGAVTKATEDPDEKAVVNALSSSALVQIRELGIYVSEKSSFASEKQRSEASRAIKISDGISLAKNGKSIFGSISSFIGSLGISKIVQELKKIVEAIFDAFGWTMPRWLRVLLLLIDEIINAILGAKSTKLASALSRQEQDYLAEMTVLSRWKNASAEQGNREDDNEE